MPGLVCNETYTQTNFTRRYAVNSQGERCLPTFTKRNATSWKSWNVQTGDILETGRFDRASLAGVERESAHVGLIG